MHGLVRNAATGEPLARALVEIEGDANSGSLTDGEGRFEIPNLPTGPQILIVRKPGFLDRPSAGPSDPLDYAPSPTHSVLVAAEMPDLVFTLHPSAAIYGQIVLSTGDPAEGIGVRLLQRNVQNGRGVWRTVSAAKTNSAGAYRFAGLCNCTYAVHTEPAMDSQRASSLIAPGSTIERAGYPSVFYPEARDLAGAAKFRLSEGQQTSANFTLTLEPFRAISAQVSGNSQGKTGQDANFAVTVLDSSGNILSYIAQFDADTGTIQSELPDGSYSLRVTAFRPSAMTHDVETEGNSPPAARVMVGSADFTVHGHAISDLRIPLSTPPLSSVQLTLVHSGEPDGKPVRDQNRQGTIDVLADQTGGWTTDGMTTQLARGLHPGSNHGTYLPPGPYWLHAVLAGSHWCEQSFTSGGENLARGPLILNLAGGTIPLELTLRDDCGKLTISLPQSVTRLPSGEESYYTVYLVPDFDTTVDLYPWLLRPSTGGTFTFEGLTPGNYHVYTFEAPVQLEYRNPAVLAALPHPGQSVTLSPGATANLVLEVEGH